MCELPGSVYEADRNGKLWFAQKLFMTFPREAIMRMGLS